MNESKQMTELLQKAFEEATLLPQPTQDALAVWILEEIAFERQWLQVSAKTNFADLALPNKAIHIHQSVEV